MGVEGKAAERVWPEINRLVCAFHTQQAIDTHITGDQTIPPQEKVAVAAAWRKLFYWNTPQQFGEALWDGFLGAVNTFLQEEAVAAHADNLVPYLRQHYGLPAFRPAPGKPFAAGVTVSGTAADAGVTARLKATARRVFMCFRKELVVGDRCVLSFCAMVDWLGEAMSSLFPYPTHPILPHPRTTPTGATRPTTFARASTALSSTANQRWTAGGPTTPSTWRL